MTGEIDLGGVFVHPLLIAACLALPGVQLLGWALSRVGFYRVVWHRGLFDVALTLLIWAGIAAALTGRPFSTVFVG